MQTLYREKTRESNMFLNFCRLTLEKMPTGLAWNQTDQSDDMRKVYNNNSGEYRRMPAH